MLFPTLFGILGFAAGGSFMAWLYDRKFERMTLDNATLAGALYSAEKQKDAWRDLANQATADMQAMRKQVPQRDPRTNRFVRRETVNG